MAFTNLSLHTISPEIQAQIKQLRLATKRKMNSFFAGDYRTRQKVYGIDFDQLREYSLGDDTRFIDWKSSARSNKMLVKQYMHEQSKTIILMVDVSHSTYYGSSEQLKIEAIAQVSTVISLAAHYDHARLGLLLYSSDVELYIPPKAGNKHYNFIIDTMWHFKPHQKGTNLTKACSYITKHASSDALVCVISDFIGVYDETALAIVAKKFDTVALRCLDSVEKTLPNIGFLHMKDSETGEILFVDTRTLHQHGYAQRLEKQKNAFKKIGIELCDIEPPLRRIDALISFFAHRINS